MSGEAIAGFAVVGTLVLGNILIATYGLGRLRQKVDDLCRRVTKLEDAINGKK